MQIQVSSTDVINSDNVAHINRSGKQLAFFTNDGKTWTVDFPDDKTAQAALTNILILISAVNLGGPFLTGIWPNTYGLYGGTQEVTLVGGGLDAAGSIDIGGNPGTLLTAINPQTLWFVAPANAPGTYDVTYTSPDGATATLPAAYTY
jgi:hypothetical protein